MKQVTLNIPDGQRIGEAIWEAIVKTKEGGVMQPSNIFVGERMYEIEDQDLLAKLK